MKGNRVRLCRLSVLVALSACVGDPAGPRIASIEFPDDRIQFDAVGDTLTFGATVRNPFGSVILGTGLDYSVGDSAIASLRPDAKVISVRQGRTVLTVRNPESDVIGQAVIIVDQIATTLAVRVDSAQPIVTLPVGATVPLSCAAFDKNGFPIRDDTVLVRSVKGTVTGGPCAGARVARSGYDTLVFTLGEAQARVPVIISTRPDSVGVVTAAQPLTNVQDTRYVGEDLGKPSTIALGPLVAEILAAYGNPSTNLGRARAIRDWVARTAQYGDPGNHPDNSTSNLSALPPGRTWADVNAVLSDSQRVRDVAYWADIAGDGYAVLNRLLGTLDPATGRRADDGLMVHVSGAQYRMRDITSYRFFLCTYQSVLVIKLWAAARLQGTLLQVNGHDPAAVFIPELGRWVFEDPSYNNDYLLNGIGDPLSPIDLLSLSTNGMVGRARPMRLSGPSYDPEVYIQAQTYVSVINPRGFLIVGSRMYTYTWANATPWGRIVMIDVPELASSPFNDPAGYPRVTPEEAFPTLGVVVANLRLEDSVFVVRLASNYPNHQRFERRVSGGDWEVAAGEDVLPVGSCRVEYRSVDGVGTVSATAMLDVWAPRTREFLQADNSTGLRRQARLCA